MSEPLTELEVRIIRGALLRAFVVADACTLHGDMEEGERFLSESKNHYEKALTLTDRLLKQLQ